MAEEIVKDEVVEEEAVKEEDGQERPEPPKDENGNPMKPDHHGSHGPHEYVCPGSERGRSKTWQRR